MRCILISLFCIIFVVGSKGAWLKIPILFDDEAAELTRLGEKFWSLKPAVYQSEGPLVLCQFIDECCAVEDRLKAISLMVTSIINEYHQKNRYASVINACMNSTPSCPSLHKLISPSIMKHDRSNVVPYITIILDYFTKLNNLLNNMNEYCNDEEIHALLCLSNTKLVKICAGKILQGIYDNNGYQVYQEFIVETKETLINLNEELSELFVTNTN
jgi:hypothetical protein